MNCFEFKRENNIVIILINMPGPVNIVNHQFIHDFLETVQRLEQERDAFDGIIFTAEKSTFVAGADLNQLLGFNSNQINDLFQDLSQLKNGMRRLEQLGKPVVCALNGTTLGAGFEFALCCHYRIAVDHPANRFGLPEASLGILPGGGGMTRLIHKLGVEAALPIIIEAQKYSASAAHKLGMIDEIAADIKEMLDKAISWIKNNPSAQQPWDKKGASIPGGNILNPKIARFIALSPAVILKKTRGMFPASKEILSVAKEILSVEFDTALKIESRKLIKLLLTPVAHNMINTFAIELKMLNAGGSRPENFPKLSVKKVGILGAGMMGRGIAYACASKNIDVVLLDSTIELAQKGKAYSEKLLKQHPKQNEILARIKPTATFADLTDCDLIIEAVFENADIKAEITRNTEALLNADGIFASNTSTLPITLLAKAAKKPENFIGIHFFSPVEKMPLIEIIKGKQTSDATIAKAFDFAQQIQKTPIVVNDSPGFFTSRVFTTFVDEGIRLLEEGIHPARIENLARMTGMPVGPLAVNDEVSQKLTLTIGAVADSNAASVRIAKRLIEEFHRGGRAYGGGFYDYPTDGPKQLWPKLLDLYYNASITITDQDIQERLLFRQVIEALRCYEEGVLNSMVDANIGSIFGIGFPPQTGGVLQFIKSYGLEAFLQRAHELSKAYGSRFEPPKLQKFR